METGNFAEQQLSTVGFGQIGAFGLTKKWCIQARIPEPRDSFTVNLSKLTRPILVPQNSFEPYLEPFTQNLDSI